MVLADGWNGASVLLDDLLSSIRSAGDSGLDAFFLDELRQESADERVSGSIRVDDLLLRKTSHRELGHLITLHHNHWFGSLSEDDETWTSCLLWQSRRLQGDFLDASGLPAVGLGERGGLVFVSEENVDVWNDFREFVEEELRDEWGRQVQRERLVEFGRVVGKLENGWWAHGDEEALKQNIPFRYFLNEVEFSVIFVGITGKSQKFCRKMSLPEILFFEFQLFGLFFRNFGKNRRFFLFSADSQ